jgi:hypothetical protein
LIEDVGLNAVLTVEQGTMQMHSPSILQHLKKYGQQADYEIAEAMKIPLSEVRSALTDLSAQGEISRCNVTRFSNGNPIDGMLCRISGTVPPKAPGRKPGDHG